MVREIRRDTPDYTVSNSCLTQHRGHQTHSSSSPAHHTSFGRSILSLRHREQIHHGFPPTPDHSHSASSHASSSNDRQIDAFQRHAADLLLDLLPDNASASPSAPEILSLDWTRHLLDSFLICLEEFRVVLFARDAADATALARAPLDRLLVLRRLPGTPLTPPRSPGTPPRFFDRAVKALDLCNALRDGLDLLRQWSKPHMCVKRWWRPRNPATRHPTKHAAGHVEVRADVEALSRAGTVACGKDVFGALALDQDW